MTSLVVTEPSKNQLVTGGFCRKCRQYHTIGPGDTVEFGTDLIQRLERKGTIDIFSKKNPSAKALSTEYLYGPARGKMFGILECEKPDGNMVILYAYSGQYNGHWRVEGWVPPILNVDAFIALTYKTEQRIKTLTRRIEKSDQHHPQYQILRQRRRTLSRNLMKKIHTLYTLSNFRGENCSLSDAFYGRHGIPTGTGDCCAPKLLHFAARKNLRPIGLSEFYFGKATRSGSHRHGIFTTPCAEKCSPILGYMLCGLQ